MTKEQLITELWAYKGGSKSITDVLTAIDAYASTAKPNVSGELPKFTANDVDGAYFLGVFNNGGIDGLSEELKRIKDLGFMPHQMIDMLKVADR